LSGGFCFSDSDFLDKLIGIDDVQVIQNTCSILF